MELTREPASWMVSVDDRILEILSVYGSLRLYPLHHRLETDGHPDTPVNYLLLRCKRLREYGLITQQDGRFTLTTTGQQYLDGRLDADLLTYDGPGLDEHPADPLDHDTDS